MKKKKKLIILIGGCPGTGKTTFANALQHRLKIDHRIGTGFIREILRSEAKNRKPEYLFRYTFGGDPIETLELQARKIYPSVVTCIKRARREGTSLIIEGSHLIPSLYHDTKKLMIDYYFNLVIDDEKELLRRLHGETHLYRKISRGDLRKIKKQNEYYIRMSQRFHVDVSRAPCSFKEQILPHLAAFNYE